jgi:hypothetical protein
MKAYKNDLLHESLKYSERQSINAAGLDCRFGAIWLLFDRLSLRFREEFLIFSHNLACYFIILLTNITIVNYDWSHNGLHMSSISILNRRLQSHETITFPVVDHQVHI